MYIIYPFKTYISLYNKCAIVFVYTLYAPYFQKILFYIINAKVTPFLFLKPLTDLDEIWQGNSVHTMRKDMGYITNESNLIIVNLPFRTKSQLIFTYIPNLNNRLRHQSTRQISSNRQPAGITPSTCRCDLYCCTS